MTVVYNKATASMLRWGTAFALSAVMLAPTSAAAAEYRALFVRNARTTVEFVQGRPVQSSTAEKSTVRLTLMTEALRDGQVPILKVDVENWAGAPVQMGRGAVAALEAAQPLTTCADEVRDLDPAVIQDGEHRQMALAVAWPQTKSFQVRVTVGSEVHDFTVRLVRTSGPEPASIALARQGGQTLASLANPAWTAAMPTPGPSDEDGPGG